jgi:FkbM family methyltransferase
MRAALLYRAYRARWRDQRAEIGEMLRLLRPGDAAVDIGAHKGAYLYWMRKAVGPQGRVFAFEPQPRLHGYLGGVVSGFGWANVELSPLALSDRHGEATIHVPAGAGETSPGASLEKQAGYGIPVRTDTLDAALSGRAAPAFIKCDVEGHELGVFRGAARTLERSGPALLFECEQRHLAAHTMQEVFGYLLKLGYAGQFFAGGRLLPLAEFDPLVHQRREGARFWDRKDYSNNFLFLKRR